MAKKQLRNNAYYEGQLKQRHPSIYADFLAGKYALLAQALIAAGIKKPLTSLHELKNAWTKATPLEQQQFVQWLQTQGVTVASARPSISPGSAVAVDRKLTPWASGRVKAIMANRDLQLGDVMQELGFQTLDTSLGTALRRGTKLQPDVIMALEKWLKANKSM